MDFHLFLSSAIIFASPYVLRPVHSVISSIHILLGLPLGFVPYILPSRIYRCVSPLEPLITCPAYSSFLFFILLMKCKLVCIKLTFHEQYEKEETGICRTCYEGF